MRAGLGKEGVELGQWTRRKEAQLRRGAWPWSLPGPPPSAGESLTVLSGGWPEANQGLLKAKRQMAAK